MIIFLKNSIQNTFYICLCLILFSCDQHWSKVSDLSSKSLSQSTEVSVPATQPVNTTSSTLNNSIPVVSESLSLGVNGHPFQQESYQPNYGVTLELQIDLVKKLNAQWYRVGVKNLDQTLAVARSQGVHLLPVIMAPGTLVASDSNDVVYQKSYDYAFSLVNTYKDAIHVWELTNEQDIVALLKKGDSTPVEYLKNGCNLNGVWNCGGTAGINTYDYDETRYQRIKSVISGLADGIRAADINAQRMINFGGWLHMGFFQRIENDKIPYEIVSIHWYSGQGEITCPGESYPCPEKPKYFNVVAKLQEITKNKPMWMTETNYIYNLTSAEDQDKNQSDYLSTVLARYKNNPKAYPFKVVFTYELLDEPYFGVTPESHYGLYTTVAITGGRRLGTAKPAFNALSNLFTGTLFSSY